MLCLRGLLCLVRQWGTLTQLVLSSGEKTALLRRMGERLQLLSSDDAILLLKHHFTLPKLLYNHRTSPCFLSLELLIYDNLLKTIVSGITNIHYEEDDPAWTQATLPMKLGGLGIWSAVQLAPSAFLASAAGSSELHGPPYCSPCARAQLSRISRFQTMQRLKRIQWSENINTTPPEGVAQYRQKVYGR